MNIDFDDLFDTEPAEDIEAVHETEVQSDGNESGNEADENAETEQTKTDDVDVDVGDGKAKKKRVSRPQPKLNGDRLCGARGIGIMEHTFSGVTFQGRGHEQADLAVLMAKLQHWAHRMFPKMPFDSALERIEKLGKTKPVHTNVRKIRMGLSVLPTVIDDDDDPTVRGAPEVDVFDELIGDAARHEPRPSSPVRDEPSQPSQSSQAAPATTLSEEQQERMRKNRELAQLRRMRAQFSQQQAQARASPSGPAQMAPQLTPAPGSAEVELPASPPPGPAQVAPQSAPVPESPREAVRSPPPTASQDSQGDDSATAATSSQLQSPLPGESQSQSSPTMSQVQSPVPVQSRSAFWPADGSQRKASVFDESQRQACDAPNQAAESPEHQRGVLEEHGRPLAGLDASSSGPMELDAEPENVAPRAGHLHQMSEAPAVAIAQEQDSSVERVGHLQMPGAPAVAVAEEQDSSVERVGHLHQMSETQAANSTEVQETSAPRLGHLHEMSETAAPASVVDAGMDSEGE